MACFPHPSARPASAHLVHLLGMRLSRHTSSLPPLQTETAVCIFFFSFSFFFFVIPSASDSRYPLCPSCQGSDWLYKQQLCAGPPPASVVSLPDTYTLGPELQRLPSLQVVGSICHIYHLLNLFFSWPGYPPVCRPTPAGLFSRDRGAGRLCQNPSEVLLFDQFLLCICAHPPALHCCSLLQTNWESSSLGMLPPSYSPQSGSSLPFADAPCLCHHQIHA